MSNPTHPKCGKSCPGGSIAGHCSGCCETFIGLAAFEAHRRGEHGVNRHCEITDKHWADSRGYYHVGAKLTEEQKVKMWGGSE